jgi:peptidoglycan/LPS O-acetylase OafA/YrhL
MAVVAVARYKRSVPARPLVFVLGLLLCLAGAITCATAAANDPQAFPSLSDGLVIVGGMLVILGVAGRDARGRQLLGRHRQGTSTPPVRTDPSNDHEA